jgi:hypothetical protein
VRIFASACSAGDAAGRGVRADRRDLSLQLESLLQLGSSLQQLSLLMVCEGGREPVGLLDLRQRLMLSDEITDTHFGFRSPQHPS